MSAREVINIINELPDAEKRLVVSAVSQLNLVKPESPLKYASMDAVKAVSEKVFRVNEELFRKLAQ